MRLERAWRAGIATARSFAASQLYRLSCVICISVLTWSVMGGSCAAQEDLPPDPVEPNVDLGASFGAGFMRGGQGGLTAAQRTPFSLEVQVLSVQDARWLIGGALRFELEEAKAVAGIARVALRHRIGSLELRPGVGLPVYLAPQTMLGAEASLGFRYAMSNGFGVIGLASASAFIFGSDVPTDSTVIMFHLFLGVDLLI